MASASNRMIIPDNINVGYQNRDGTYTGKLAYVVYTDAKGVLRKEKSWKSWRDNKIESNTFTNEPTSGFVLNKGVGGTRESYGWNPRNEYIRVFDPRGFEFEISVANLLFILQETTSTKGKGLEGEFVYSWDGADLVLLPTGSNEFKECSKYTDHQLGKVDKKDVVEGCSYLMKNMVKVIYLGRHDWYEQKYDYTSGGNFIEFIGKKHIFKSLEKGNYFIQNGFTRLAERLSNEVLPQYANDYEDFRNSIHASPSELVRIVKKNLLKKEIKDMWWRISVLVKEEDDTFKVMDITREYHHPVPGELENRYQIVKRNDFFKPDLVDGKCLIPTAPPTPQYNYYDTYKTKVTLSESELLSTQFYTAEIVNTNGTVLNLFGR